MKNMKLVTDCLDKLRVRYKNETLAWNKTMADSFRRTGDEYTPYENEILASYRGPSGTKETVFIHTYEPRGYHVTEFSGFAKCNGPDDEFKPDIFIPMLEANTGAQLGKWCLGTEESWGYNALIYIVRLYSRKQKNFRMDAKLVKRSLIEVTEAVTSLKSKLGMRPAKKRSKA